MINFKALLESIEQNKCGSNFTCKKLNENEIEMFAEALKKNTSIKTLIFFDVDLKQKGGVAIAKALATNTSITDIDLSECNLNPVAMRAIALALMINNTLRSLCLSYNDKINMSAAHAFAKAIKINKTLTSISFNGLSLGAAGPIIVGALKYNTTLEVIQLRDNILDPPTAFKLAETLETNTALQRIHLESNTLCTYGCRAIVNALQKNTTVKWIYLEDAWEGEKSIIFAEDKYLLECARRFTERNREIHSIRKDIKLLSDTLSNIPKLQFKEIAEAYYISCKITADTLSRRIKALAKTDCLGSIIEELQREFTRASRHLVNNKKGEESRTILTFNSQAIASGKDIKLKVEKAQVPRTRRFSLASGKDIKPKIEKAQAPRIRRFSLGNGNRKP